VGAMVSWAYPSDRGQHHLVVNPSSFGSLTNLEELRLYNNDLSHSIPPRLFALPKLKELELQINQFNGSLETTLLSNRSALIHVNLDFNQLSGALPRGLFDIQRYIYGILL
jgi:LRR receptor-like serine/threonine-protein kinase FLS2